MPRSKYTKTPGPLPPIERISREAFRFDDESRRELICLLPLELQQLPVPENIEQEVPELPGASQHETLAKLIVAWTEHQIQSYLTTRRLGIGRSANPANVAAAIRKLRAALKPFTNLPTTNSKDNLPARIDPGVDVILRETARANPMLRFKEGEYLVGEDKIPLGREYLVYPLDWTRGWVKWEDGIIVDQRMVRVADDIKLPKREELGDNDESLWEEEKDPWVFQNILPMDDLETREYMIFVTSSVGGKVAVETLCNSVVRAYKKGRQFGLPVIRLATKPFPTKFGTKPRPHFPIVRWHDLPPVGEDMPDEVPF